MPSFVGERVALEGGADLSWFVPGDESVACESVEVTASGPDTEPSTLAKGCGVAGVAGLPL